MDRPTLRDVIVRGDLPAGLSGRDALDNPGVAVFDDPRSRHSTFVLSGLGFIDHEAAAGWLAEALSSRDTAVRVVAAMGLGRQSDPSAAAALVTALGDPEYLVRYHAMQGLAVHALAAVRARR